MDFDTHWLALGLAAMFAGFVDAVVGGGGLIQIPALLTGFPSEPPARLFGTNKLASIVGTTSAALQYAKRVPIPWSVALPGAGAALLGSWYGARLVSALDPAFLRPLVLVLLLAVATYTFRRKDFGAERVVPAGRVGIHIPLFIGGGVGVYDGFFGPGTGTFFIFLLIRFAGMTFLGASVTAKILNAATNLAAISFFGLTGAVMWKVGAGMALCNLLGAQLGSRLALRRGVPFVRQVFLAVVLVLMAKLALDLVRPTT